MAFCVLTYALNLLPYIAVNRSAFCYHYMPALMYAELLSALTMDRLFGEAPAVSVWAWSRSRREFSYGFYYCAMVFRRLFYASAPSCLLPPPAPNTTSMLYCTISQATGGCPSRRSS